MSPAREFFPSDMGVAEKRMNNRLRYRVRKNAWAAERERVLRGCGTRDWSVSEQRELIDKSKVSGYEVQHMKSVKEYPQYAGVVENTQFLTHEEHLDAHRHDYHNATNGFYDPKTGEMTEFDEEGLEPAPVMELSEKYADTMEEEDEVTMEEISEAETQQRMTEVSMEDIAPRQGQEESSAAVVSNEEERTEEQSVGL